MSPRCARPTRLPRWWSASAAPRRSRRRSCARAFFPPLRSHPRRRSSLTGRCSTSGSPNGGAAPCGSPIGCSAPLHPGHIKLLSEAHAACDRLIVGLNDDASVRRLKGEGRPLQEVHARAEVLAALEAVDLVVIFGQDTPLELIRRVHPKVLVKG